MLRLSLTPNVICQHYFSATWKEDRTVSHVRHLVSLVNTPSKRSCTIVEEVAAEPWLDGPAETMDVVT